MNDHPKDFTLDLPPLGGGDAPRTITLSRAAVTYLVYHLGSGYPEQVRGAFGALGLGALAAPYLLAHKDWMAEFLAVGDRRCGGAPVDVWVAGRVVGNEAGLARLRLAYGQMQEAWQPLQAFIDRCREALRQDAGNAAAPGRPLSVETIAGMAG